MTKKLTLLVACLVLMFLLQGCGDSNVDLVKNGNFYGYPSLTIGKFLDSSFSSPKWSSYETTKGEVKVVFEGAITQKMHEAIKEKLLEFHRVFGGNARNSRFTLYASVVGSLPSQNSSVTDFLRDLKAECWRGSNDIPINSQAWIDFREECADKMENVVDEEYWKAGDNVFFEWMINSSGESFDLVSFGGNTLGRLNLDEFLKMIYSVE